MGGEAAFLKALLCPDVPIQCLEVNSFQIGLRKSVVEHGANGVSAVAAIPVSPVTNHDAELGLSFSVVYVEIAAIADMSTIQGFNGEAMATDWVAQFFSVVL